jgi:hypothetical protein
MGAETLSALGHNDQLARWADEYVRRHQAIPAPPAERPVDLNDDRAVAAAIGDQARVSDWTAAFRHQLQERPWLAVITFWAPRLLPGYAGALTHGMIRTAHAVRALPRDETPSALMLDELARGLALWAASFKIVPGEPRLAGSLPLAVAIERLPRPETPWPLFEAGTFEHIEELQGFPAAVEAFGAPKPSDKAFSLLSAHFCRVILAHPSVISVPLVHTITPIAAVRTLMPYLAASLEARLVARLWHVGAAITVAFTPRAAAPSPLVAPTIGADEVLARAAEHGDPHVLKFAEACARENTLNSDPATSRPRLS